MSKNRLSFSRRQAPCFDKCIRKYFYTSNIQEIQDNIELINHENIPNKVLVWVSGTKKGLLKTYVYQRNNFTTTDIYVKERL